MVQFFWTASPADIGGPPSDLALVQPWAPFSAIEVVDEATATPPTDPSFPASLEIRRTQTGGARRLVAFTAIGGVPVPDSADAEVFMHFVAIGSANEARAALRANLSMPDSSATTLTGGLKRSQGEGELARYIDAVFTELARDPSLNQGANIYKQRVRVEGDLLRARIWLAADPEPADWQLSATGLGIADPGAVGYFQFSNTTNFFNRVLALGIGTDGDPAPTEVTGSSGEAISGPAAMSVRGLAFAGSGRIREFGSATAAIAAPRTQAAGGPAHRGVALLRLATPGASATGAFDGLSRAAARLARTLANAAGRLRVSGLLAPALAAPRIAASGTGASPAGPGLAPGRTLRVFAPDRHRRAAAGARMLVPSDRVGPLAFSPEEIDHG